MASVNKKKSVTFSPIAVVESRKGPLKSVSKYKQSKFELKSRKPESNETIVNITTTEGKIINNGPGKNLNIGVLENLQHKTIPIGPKLKNELRKYSSQNRSLNIKTRQKENLVPSPLPESSEKVYGVPELHSTLRVAKQLQKVKDQDLDLSLLVQNKLRSPTTSGRLKKKTAIGVTVNSNKQVFKDLVSADISTDNLLHQLEEELNIKANIVRPTLRNKDPVPEQSDYFCPEDYITRMTVVSKKLDLPKYTDVEVITSEDLFKYNQDILGII